MSATGPIESYLAELDRALGVPRGLRRRIVAEARDHLECAAAAGRADGLAPDAAAERAVAAFGAAGVVARRFAEELAVAGARRATIAALVAVWNHGLLFAVSTQVASVRAASPFASDPADAIGWFAAQVAVVCAAIGAVRALRHRRDGAVPAGKLRYMTRGAAVAVGAVLVSVIADAAAAVAHPAAGTAGPTRTVLLAAVAVVGAVAAGALVEVARATARVRALARHEDSPAGDDVLDDVLALAAAMRPMPMIGAAVTAARRLAPALRAHPWRLCALVGGGAGLGLTVAHAMGEGAPPGPGAALAVLGVFVGAEALAVLVCFAALGRFLGLRR